MDLAMFFTLMPIWLAAIASPGPDIVQILRLGARARADGIACALGIMVGNSTWILGSLFGLSALVAATPALLTSLKLLGGAYLLWLGVQALRSGFTGAEDSDRLVHKAGGSHDWWGAFRLGVFTNLSNPKAAIFFAAVFAQFVKPELGVGGSLLVALVLIVSGLMWFVGVAFVVRTAGALLQRHAAVIEIGSGLVFCAVASVMLVGGLLEAYTYFYE